MEDLESRGKPTGPVHVPRSFLRRTLAGDRDRKEGTARLLCRMCDINYEMAINCKSHVPFEFDPFRFAYGGS